VTVTTLALRLTETGRVPDPLVRAGIRALLAQRRREVSGDDAAEAGRLHEAFARAMHEAPVAPLPHKANEQHYELPPAFFEAVLGPRRKYSSCWWPAGTATLEAAEEAALAATCARAGIADGQRVLELGCGWGSLTLWMAERYPKAQITAVSNSAPQRLHIEATARARGLGNVRVITADINAFSIDERFDRIVSVEMFEHLRNWPEAFRRVRGWLADHGRFFMHVFVHRDAPYAFEPRDDGDWMSRYFFSGGMMPSDDLALRFQDDLRLLERWRWDGTHYQRTAEAWLARMDANREAVDAALAQAYGAADVALWRTRWRLFFMACAELFGAERGQRWWVSHYLFEPRA
jgi:cyclopropane-fatty-acyl-phospholipid synthase